MSKTKRRGIGRNAEATPTKVFKYGVWVAMLGFSFDKGKCSSSDGRGMIVSHRVAGSSPAYTTSYFSPK